LKERIVFEPTISKLGSNTSKNIPPGIKKLNENVVEVTGPYINGNYIAKIKKDNDISYMMLSATSGSGHIPILKLEEMATCCKHIRNIIAGLRDVESLVQNAGKFSEEIGKALDGLGKDQNNEEDKSFRKGNASELRASLSNQLKIFTIVYNKLPALSISACKITLNYISISAKQYK
jgi:hypothetical protein